MEPLRLLTPPKGVRRRDGNQQSTLPIHEGFELFVCDGVQIQNYEVDVEPESDDENDNNKDEDAAATTDDNEKNNKQVLKHRKPL